MALSLLMISLLTSTSYCATPPRRGMGLAMKVCDDVVAMNLSFWYDWQYFYPCSTNISVPWIPMIFKASDVQYAKTFKGTNFEAILGFNEPNAANQANMTVDESLALWPQLMDVGLPLCSPAPTRFI